MMRTIFVGALGALLLAGCGRSVCDRSDSFELSSKQGSCGTAIADKVLGPSASCTAALTACTDADKKVLESMMDCYEGLPVCGMDGLDDWLTAELACRARVEGLSAECRAGFEELIPGEEDAGVDAGVDAGRQPILDGGEGLRLIVVADESRYALAWTPLQPVSLYQWEVNARDDAGMELLPVTYVEANTQLSLLVTDAGQGETRSFFVAALDFDGGVVLGQVDGGTPVDSGMDAGMCAAPTDCPVDRICNQGACTMVSCSPMSPCPTGYTCPVTTCVRDTADGGSGTGTEDGGTVVASGALPMISNLATATTKAPEYSGVERVLSPFRARSPDVAAIDSARQVVAVEQEGQLFAFVTDNRGERFRAHRIDTLGSNPHLAYEPTTRVLYACYDAVTNLGPGVRVRRSFDFGRTWGGPTEVADLVSPAPGDGGMAVPIKDCDIAPWRDGQVIVAAVEGEDIFVQTFAESLVPGPRDLAFRREAPVQVDAGVLAGGLFEPEALALATLPEQTLVHLGFVVGQISDNTKDLEVYGVHRSPATGAAFTQPLKISGSLATGSLPQAAIALAIEPISRTPIAAFASSENAKRASKPGYFYRDNVVISFFDSTKGRWITGGDLGVFVENATKSEYLVMTERSLEFPPRDWDAYAPALVVGSSGRITLAFAAGPRDSVSDGLMAYVYSVDFDLAAPSPTGAMGWFVPPAQRVSSAPTWASRVQQSHGRRGFIASTVDEQVSQYTVFIEGLGASGLEEGRPVLLPRP